jgi:hypothetical protein
MPEPIVDFLIFLPILACELKGGNGQVLVGSLGRCPAAFALSPLSVSLVSGTRFHIISRGHDVSLSIHLNICEFTSAALCLTRHAGNEH